MPTGTTDPAIATTATAVTPAPIRLSPIQGCALREVEAAAGKGKTTLLRTYKQFTINRLVELGLIELVETRRTRGVPLATFVITSAGITALAYHMRERI